jgi:hypothetical protein
MIGSNGKDVAACIHASRLSGWRVTRCCIDRQLSLLLQDVSQPGGEVVEVTIETTFRLRDAAAVVHELQPDGLPTSLAPALGLVHQDVAHLEVREGGLLRAGFRDGAELVVEPDEEFEAWSVSADGRVRLVCLPSGGLATWS